MLTSGTGVGYRRASSRAVDTGAAGNRSGLLHKLLDRPEIIRGAATQRLASGGRMMARHFRSPWSLVLLLGRHVLAFVIFWIIGLAFVQVGLRVLGGWPAAEIGQLLACILGVAIALRIRAPIVAYLLAAMAAFSASELAIHSVYGIRAAQGAPTHFAVMGAAVLGVALGALLTRRDGWAPSSGAAAAQPDSSDGQALSTTVRPDTASSDHRSDMPLQPTSGAAGPNGFETAVSAARG
jgi:hypothetical protein